MIRVCMLFCISLVLSVFSLTYAHFCFVLQLPDYSAPILSLSPGLDLKMSFNHPNPPRAGRDQLRSLLPVLGDELDREDDPDDQGEISWEDLSLDAESEDDGR